jgi:hypothetical protein
LLVLDMFVDPWRASWAACRLGPQFGCELGRGRGGAGLGRASLLAMVDEKWGMARRAAFRRRTMPDAPRARTALELADRWCRSSAFQVLSMACGRARDRAPATCPISARRRAVLRLLRPPAFPGRMTKRTSGDCQVSSDCRLRRAPAWPSGPRLRRQKDPGALCLRAQGRTTRSSVCSGGDRRERRTGANEVTAARSTRSCGAQLS